MANLAIEDLFSKLLFYFCVLLVQLCDAKPTNQTNIKQPLSKSKDNEGNIVFIIVSCILSFWRH